MRLATVFRRLLCLQGVRVTDVELHPDALMIFVDVDLGRRSCVCSRCGRRARVGAYDSKVRLWRHLDLGPWELYLRGRQRRFHCRRCQAVVTEALPWADTGAAFTREFEDTVAYFAQQTNASVVSRTMQIAWPTVGNIVRRVVGRRGTPLAQRRLVRIGVDEISYRRHHKYLTLVADHLSGHIVWGGDGRSGATLGRFCDALGPDGRASIELVSLDMCQAYITKLRERLPHATLVFDPFHVVKLANAAVDEVRRAQVRALKGQNPARVAVKKTRWLVLKAPGNLDDEEAAKLALLAQANRPLYRAYLLKEALRDVYDGSLPRARKQLRAWLAWAARSRLPAFVKLGRTIRQYQDGILAAIEHGLSNGRLEGLNNKIRLLSHRAYGFHSADALLALVTLCCTGINPPLPADRRPRMDPRPLAFPEGGK
ncbi:MAG TPA: ISL3 family transposase [Polyangia bacterium]